MPRPNQTNPENRTGRVRSVRGSVVDARFPAGLPEVRHRLVTGPDERIVMEVASHLDDRTVRDTGAPVQVPVGRPTLGRVFNVLGEPIDGKPPLEGVERRSIHRLPVSISQQSTRRDVLRTGIKNIDAALIHLFTRYGHRVHRVSLGLLFAWFGIVKPLGHKTTTSLLADTIWWGNPEVMVLVLGW